MKENPVLLWTHTHESKHNTQNMAPRPSNMSTSLYESTYEDTSSQHHTKNNAQWTLQKSSPLHPITIIHMPISRHWPFTHTIKQLSQNSQNYSQGTSHFPLSCLSRTPYLVSHSVVWALHSVIHEITGNLNIPRHWYINLLFQWILLLRF